MRFCLCIFESDIVKSDCPAQIFKKWWNILRFNTDCWFTLLGLLFFLELLKKTGKKSSENYQLTGHLQSCFFIPSDPKSEKKIPKIN